LLLIRLGDSRFARIALTKGSADLINHDKAQRDTLDGAPIYYALLLASLHARYLLLAP
jgi:hypothetical protein